MATVSSGLGVTSDRRFSDFSMREWLSNLPKPGYKGQIQVEHILQPLYGSRRFVGQNLDEVWSRLVSGGFQGIVIKLLNTIGYAQIDLGSGESAIYTGCSLC